jgi:hypothetical protein
MMEANALHTTYIMLGALTTMDGFQKVDTHWLDGLIICTKRCTKRKVGSQMMGES